MARGGDGVNISCIPAILLARKLARGELATRGAYPCVGFITLDAYLAALNDLDVEHALAG